ncbi:MAG: ribonuclease J [Candidatus Woesebacteria bacterium]|jgi:ribonuclease J
MSLRFIALSGTVSVTENLYIYETDDKMMIVDCGVGFPDLEMHGVDLVIPDFSYVVKNKEKLAGVVLSQGHEDHIGALPFLLQELKTTIWAAPLVREFLNDKFKDYKVKGARINTFNPDNDTFSVGPFKVHPFRVTHSIPDSVGFAIDTPEGRIFHVPEHKMDPNPVSGKGFDLQRAKSLTNKDTLFLASDCLGANRPGFTESERKIEGNMYNIVREAPNAVFMTAISSNISRFQQMINVAEKTKRKVSFVGRSVQKKSEIAHDLGLLKYSNDRVVGLKRMNRLPRNKRMYIVAGCYGQVGSSLYRIALDEHDRVEIESKDTVVFSADPAPPYTKESENFVIDNLFDRGADVHYYDLDEDLYVSGHGSQEDIVELFRIVNPKYFIPIGGAIRFMHAYEKLADDFGAKPGSVFKLKPGENIIFDNGRAKLGPQVPAKEVLVHGLGIGDVGKVVLGDRAVLGNEGIAVVVIKIRKNKVVDTPEIISRGFVFEKSEKDFLMNAGKRLKGQIEKRKKLNKRVVEDTSLQYLDNFFYQKTGRRPMILPVVVSL